MPAIDISRATEGIVLPAEVSKEIWKNTLEASAVMQLANPQRLPGAGQEIQIITGEPEANWTAETGKAKVSRHTFGSKTIRGYKLTVLEPFSNEFLRDKAALYDECVKRLPFAIGRKFDETVFGPASGAPGSNFDTLGGSASVAIDGDLYPALITAKAAITASEASLSGWVLTDPGNDVIISALDGNGRPLFGDSVLISGSIDRMIGAPVAISKALQKANGADVLGFAGAWNNAVYGVVEGISIAISNQATIQDGEEVINLWQQDMVAIKVKAEMGFRIKDEMSYVKLVAADN